VAHGFIVARHYYIRNFISSSFHTLVRVSQETYSKHGENEKHNILIGTSPKDLVINGSNENNIEPSLKKTSTETTSHISCYVYFHSSIAYHWPMYALGEE
jgi:hypothetical protein